jgi:hypothetical protein
MPTTYTITQANRALPLVSRIVRDIVELYPRWRERVGEIERIAVEERAASDEGRVRALEREARTLEAEIDRCIREIRELGLEYRLPLDSGLVDFPGELNGRPVWLCWRLGEEAVEWWHEHDAGFAGRRPLAPSTPG